MEYDVSSHSRKNYSSSPYNRMALTSVAYSDYSGSKNKNCQKKHYTNVVSINDTKNYIKNLQSQLNKLYLKIKEKNKKISIQEKIIESLQEQNKQLNEEIIRKNLLIQQNKNIDSRISQMEKKYIFQKNDSNNELYLGNNYRLYIEKLKQKNQEIINCKNSIFLLTKKLNYKEKENLF